MFSQKVTITEKQILEFLLEKGHLHKSFSNANLTEIIHETIKAQDFYLQNTIKLEFRTKKLSE